MHHDEKTARCYVLTYKEGVLAGVAHDLRIDVTRFSVDVADDGSSVVARFEAGSLRVAGAMEHGRVEPDALSVGDKRKIEENIGKDVLDVRRHPQVELVSTRVAPEGDGHRIDAKLRLHGIERALTFVTKKEGAHEVARVRLHQPDYGITPYKAMLGALRIRADVDVVLELPLG